MTGGTLLEAFARYDHLRSLAIRRRLNRATVVRNALPFLFARTAGRGAAGFGQRVRTVFGRGRDDAAMVQHHYDVSNAFYRLFLDANMQYSAGYFADPNATLDQAQLAKMDRICRKLTLAPGKRLLDIGCGWGGLACHAAEHFGAQVHGLTLSAEQLALARERVRDRGLEHLVTLELRDYRAIEQAAEYDAACQIGMFEHVGLRNHDAHFAQVHRVLKPGGLYIHQSITRRAPHDLRRFTKPTTYRRFLDRYIFPGGELDYFGLTATNLERNAFEVLDVESMRAAYHRTLVLWIERLEANGAAAIGEVGAMRTRLWRLYLAMCALAFQRGIVMDFQILAQKRITGLSDVRPLR